MYLVVIYGKTNHGNMLLNGHFESTNSCLEAYFNQQGLGFL